MVSRGRSVDRNFFFFKQKTAYEIKECDWSSDVCSSDLVAFENETDPALASAVDEIVWLKVGQLSKMISAFTEHRVKYCVMAGQIAPKNLYDIRPDLRAMALLFRLKEKNAHTIFGAIADE